MILPLIVYVSQDERGQPLEHEHFTPGEFQAFIEGGLDRRDRLRMLERLDRCPLCVKLLADGVREERVSRAR